VIDGIADVAADLCSGTCSHTGAETAKGRSADRTAQAANDRTPQSGNTRSRDSADDGKDCFEGRTTFNTLQLAYRNFLQIHDLAPLKLGKPRRPRGWNIQLDPGANASFR